MKFQNLKIAITDEVHLKAVCDVLESMGYKSDTRSKNKIACIYTWDIGSYDVASKMIVDSLPNDFDDGHKQATLTDLLKMHDDAFKGVIR